MTLVAAINEPPVMGDAGLKAQFARAARRRRMQALLPVLPLLLFLGAAFVAPVAAMLFRSADNAFIHEALAETAEALGNWDETADEPPPDAVFAALIADARRGTLTKLGQRFNHHASGMSSLFRKTARGIRSLPADVADPRAALLGIDEQWNDLALWRTIKHFSGPFTAAHYWRAADFAFSSETGGYDLADENRRVYVRLFLRTLAMSAIITLLALLLGYPTAFLIASLPPARANLLLILVLLPFWTSLLVRTTAWIVLLYREGVVNDALLATGILSGSDRLELIHNKTGTLIAMTHILLPFMILPLYSVMKTIPPAYMRAARSLGASGWTAFWRVYFPQTVPGAGAGALLVFILAVGYYITPELVGGADGTFISNRIAYHMRSSGNWGLAAALGLVLLALVLALYWCYDRLAGASNIRIG